MRQDTGRGEAGCEDHRPSASGANEHDHGGLLHEGDANQAHLVPELIVLGDALALGLDPRPRLEVGLALVAAPGAKASGP
jgi:hypothetical protein